MSEILHHRPGTFCWADGGTTNLEAALPFYQAVLGWTYAQEPMAAGGTYVLAQVGGRDVAGLFQTGTTDGHDCTSHWLALFAVASADQAARRAQELGGRVIVQPHDVGGSGRMAVIVDPTGAAFGIWEAGQHPGTRVMGEPGALCWAELATRDTRRAAAFYEALFGWTHEEMPSVGQTYTRFRDAEGHTGGMLQILDTGGDMPPSWQVYFLTVDCEAAVRAVKEQGGATLVDTTPIPGVGRFAVVRDCAGAVFSLMEPLPELMPGRAAVPAEASA